MIPYTVDPRADTGVTNVTMGIWLFLASEVMLFGSLFSAYALLRVTGSAGWPIGRTVLSLPFGATNTVILLVATVLAWRARSAGVAAGRRGLLRASGLAMVFLALKAMEYRDELGRGLVPSINTFMAIYFTLTGFHALHVVGGLVASVWALSGVSRVGDRMTLGRIRALGLYWAFVDVVWVVIFILLYLS